MFGKRLKELRELNGYSMDKVIELYNNKFNGKMNKSTLSRYENGLQEPMYTVVVNLADLFCVSVDYLSGAVESKKGINFPPEPNITEEYATFPVIGEVAAGYEHVAIEDWEGDVVDIPLSYLHGRSKSDFFVLRVNGDSMYPEYRENDKVLVLKQSTLDYSGQVGVVIYNDDNATLKKVEYVPGEDWMKLIPINPTYPVVTIENESLEHCKVLGIPRLLIRETTGQVNENISYIFAEPSKSFGLSLMEKYSRLNSMGKNRTDAYIDGLLENPSYRKNGS